MNEKVKMYDSIHNPSHYTRGRKDDIVQDLMKAVEFINFEISAIREENGGK